eukprot:4757493-Lingulodinium_polyedra.AAC.1
MARIAERSQVGRNVAPVAGVQLLRRRSRVRGTLLLQGLDRNGRLLEPADMHLGSHVGALGVVLPAQSAPAP